MKRELGEGYSFTKKKCFVYGSLSHLIKDCDFYEKKMAREVELTKQRVFNTSNGVAKPVWNIANKVNHANHFVPRPVIINYGMPNINSVRPNINTGRTNVNSVKQNVNSDKSKVNTGSFNVYIVRHKQPVPTSISTSFNVERPHVNKEIEELLLRPQQVIIGESLDQTPIVIDHPLKNMVDRGIFDSGCSGHMTGNKDHLDDFEEFNRVSSDFKMPDENQILLKVPRMLGHINFKNLNKLVKGNLVRGLPSKVFRNDNTCVACHKGKQHRAFCKAKLERTITEPLHTLHMDLFGPTSVKSINHASYCFVIADDCTRFSWVFFLASKDETSGILQNFIRQIENQLNHRVKIIRSDNGTEFNNRDMLEFCGNKGIK
ncbi:putative ribonuclease H-like domain-containing protein [Tanacetum coccineum]